MVAPSNYLNLFHGDPAAPQGQFAGSASQRILTANAYPPVTAGLVAGYRADLGFTLNGANVSGLADQSGNGFALTQATSGDQPPYNTQDPLFFGRPSIGQFTVSGGTSLANASFTVSQPNTIYFVGYATSSTQNTFFDGSSSRQILGRYSSTQWWIYAGTTVPISGADSNVHVFCLTFSAGTGTLYMDNSQTALGSGSAGTDALTGLVIGAGAGDTAFVGSFEEGWFYSGAHAATTRFAMMQYLGARVGVSTS